MPLAAEPECLDPSTEAPVAARRSLAWLGVAWTALLVLLASELVILTLPFHTETDLANPGRWLRLLIYLQESARPAFATGAAAAIFFSRRVLGEEFTRAMRGSSSVISWRWLGLHFALLGILVAGTLARRDGRLTSVASWEAWLVAWSALAVASHAAWCATALPPRFWLNWMRGSPLALAAGAAVGLAAIVVGDSLKSFWWLLERPTFEAAVIVLRLLGQRPVAIPAELELGTAYFSVSIGPACSGLEGMGLVTVVLAVYLWYRRGQLIFPRALLILPVGWLASWLLNVMRIAVLVVIGGWSSDAAVKGFHSVAGWLMFNTLACGLVWGVWRFALFERNPGDRTAAGRAGAYLLPMLLMLAASMVARAFWPSLQFSYALGVFSVLLIIGLYRHRLDGLGRRPSWLAVAGGALAALMWFGWSGGAALSDSLLLMPAVVATLRAPSWLMLVSVAGALPAVALAEELCFRGFLARRLVSIEFEAVPFGQFHWLAFLGSSLAYGLLHVAWLPAIAAGMVYAGLMYRQGALIDAIVAHLTCSALLLVLALQQA